MKRNPILIVLTITFVLLTCSHNSWGETDSISHRIQEVVLYRESALVTREINIPAEFEGNEVVINDLPLEVSTKSVRASSETPIQIRSIRCQTIAQTSTQDAVDPAELKRLRTELKNIKNQLEIVEQKKTILAQLTEFNKFAKTEDLNRGLLDAKNTTAMATYSIEETQKILIEKHALQAKSTEVSNQLSRLESRQKRRKMKVQATIRFDGNLTQPAKIKLRYTVTNVGWEPRITLRGSRDGQKLNLKYDAVVRQATGESWENIRLLFSSSFGDRIPTSPILTSLQVTTDEQNESVRPFGSNAQDEIETTDPADFTSLQYGSARDRDLSLNLLAAQLQQHELSTASSLQQHARDAFDEVSHQIYPIDSQMTVPAKAGNQIVTLVETDFAAETYFTSVPLLSSYAFRESTAVNSTDLSFPGGVATVYLEDRLIGDMELRPIASGQKITVGLGVDPQIRLRRELIEKTERLNGGNRQIQFFYKLVAANFKDEKVSIRMYDRMPHSSDAQSISVKLGKLERPISSDPLYLRMQRPKGILRWDTTLEPRTFGAKANDLKYDFVLEFDKNQTPVTDFSDAEIIAEYGKARLRQEGGGGFGGGGFGGGGAFNR